MNPYLIGNGWWCEACSGTGRGRLSSIIEYTGGGEARFFDPCAGCGGSGRCGATFDQARLGTAPRTNRAWHTTLSNLIEYGRDRGGRAA